MRRISDFDIAFVRDHAFGVVAGVHVPRGKEPVPEPILTRLHPDEAGVARSLRGFRQVEWTGGRLAWHAAAARLGVSAVPLLSGSEREPLPPSGLSASITHKRDLAIALVGDAARGWVGVDLENDADASTTIAARILRPEEIRAVETLPESARAAAVLLRFSVKEATYKAIYPLLRRFVGYTEARVDVAASGAIAVTLLLKDGAEVPTLEATCERFHGRILSAVRCLSM
jgi:4'-phosphopantetheinyl transferase EntD